MTVLALTHIGPENPARGAPSFIHPNTDLRYLNDVLLIYKYSDALTLIAEFNFIKDDGYHAIGCGAAEYFKYTIDDRVALVGRGEVWRDNGNFFVAAFPGNRDFIELERGLPLERGLITSAGPTTYSEVTIGVNITPSMSGSIQGLNIRPEIRYDYALNGTKPYGNGTDQGQITFGLDVILKL